MNSRRVSKVFCFLCSFWCVCFSTMFMHFPEMFGSFVLICSICIVKLSLIKKNPFLHSRFAQYSAPSPAPSVSADSPIEVGGPISLTTTSRTPPNDSPNQTASSSSIAGLSAVTTTPSFSSHIFGSFAER